MAKATLQFRPTFRLQPHPDARLQTPWSILQIGIALLPFSALIGSLAALVAAIDTWRRVPQQIHQRSVNRGFALLGLWLIVTTLFAVYRTDAWLGLANFLPLFVVFAALSALIQSPVQLRQLAWIVVLSSVPVIVIGLGQLFWGWEGHLKLFGIVIDLLISRGGNPLGRMASVFSYANVLASYLIVPFILGMGLWIEAYPGRKAKNWTQWIFLTLVVGGNAIALILTNSRNAWGIVALAGLAFALYLGWRWLVAAVAAVVSIVLLAAFGPSPLKLWLRAIVPAFFWARISDEMYPNRPLALLRTTQWQFAWSMTQQRPLTGWGLRNFTPLYQAKWQVFLGHPHNLPLMLSAETGILGAVLLIGLVGWVVFQGVQLFRIWPTATILQERDRLIFFSYLTAFLACSLFHVADITLFDARINLLGWLLLAAIAGLVYHQSAIATDSIA